MCHLVSSSSFFLLKKGWMMHHLPIQIIKKIRPKHVGSFKPTRLALPNPLAWLFVAFVLFKIYLMYILLIDTYFIWNNLWNCNYYYFNFIIFQFFYLLELISIILFVIILLEIIYKIRFFFNFILIQLFNL